jgi:hypothetical protein
MTVTIEQAVKFALRKGALILLAQAFLAAAPLAAAAGAAAAKAPQRFLSPSSRDGVADAAVFGAAAREVSVYNLRGRLVFHQTQQGGAPIVWDCRDGGGRIVPSGVYIARIRTADSEIVYQSFALVK